MKLLTQGMLTVRYLLVTTLTATLSVGCGGDSGGGSSSSSGSGNVAPTISAPTSITMNERATDSVTVYSKADPDKQVIVQFEHVSGPELTITEQPTVGNKHEFTVTAPKTSEDEVSLYKVNSHTLYDPSNQSEAELEFNIDFLDPRAIETSKYALGQDYELEAVIGAGVDLEFDQPKQNRCMQNYEVEIVPHSKGSSFHQEQTIHLESAMEFAQVKADLSIVGKVSLGDFEYKRQVNKRNGQIALYYLMELNKDLQKVVAPHKGEVMKLKPEYHELLSKDYLGYRLRCGTGYVAEVYTGAQIVTGLLFEFSNYELKEELTANGKFVVGTLSQLKTTLNYLKEKHSKDVSIMISSHVKGGDAELIYSELNNSDIMSCTNNIDKCIDAVSSINNAITSNSAYFESVKTNPAVIKVNTFSYRNSVDLPADYQDTILTPEERNASDEILKMYVHELSYQSYTSKLNRLKISFTDFEKHEDAVTAFESDNSTVSSRLELIKDANERCQMNQIGCDVVLSELNVDLGSYPLVYPTMPWILQSELINEREKVDVLCIPKDWKTWVITGVGRKEEATQYYEHYPMAVRLRKINDDQTLGEEKYMTCRGGHHQKYSWQPVSETNTGTYFNSQPSGYVWLYPQTPDYILKELKEGTSFRKTMQYFGAVFVKYNDGEVVNHWTDKKARYYNNLVEYDSLGTHQVVTAPNGGWISGFGVQRSETNVQPIVAFTAKPL